MKKCILSLGISALLIFNVIAQNVDYTNKVINNSFEYARSGQLVASGIDGWNNNAWRPKNSTEKEFYGWSVTNWDFCSAANNSQGINQDMEFIEGSYAMWLGGDWVFPDLFELYQIIDKDDLPAGTYKVQCRLAVADNKKTSQRLFANQDVQYHGTPSQYVSNLTEGENNRFANWPGGEKILQEMIVYTTIGEDESLKIGIRTGGKKGDSSATANASPLWGWFKLDYFRVTKIDATDAADAGLADLTLSIGDLNFSTNITTYQVELPTGTAFVTPTAIPNIPDATVTGTDAVDVRLGSGVSTITVTALNGTTTKTYTINYTTTSKDPEPNEIIDGKARFTVLTPTTIRTEYAGDGIFESRTSFNIAHKNLPLPSFTTTVEDGWRIIQTEKVTLLYKQDSGAFNATNLIVSLTVDEQLIDAKPWSATAFVDKKEAEKATLFGEAKIATDHAKYDGTGFVAGLKSVGAGIEWSGIEPFAEGEYVLSLRYSNGMGSLRTISLYVDNEKTQITLNQTVDWNTWALFQKVVTLSAGQHTFKIMCEAADNYNVNIDWLAITPSDGELPVENNDNDKANLGAWSRGLDTKNAAIPLWDGILSRDGWYLLDDSETALHDGTGWVVDRPVHAGGYQDGYFFGYGTNYQLALKDFYQITGNPVFLPKWAFGVWYSINSETYTNANYYQNVLLPKFRSEKIPLEVLVVDTDWKTPERWNGWNWHTTNFPNPQSFMDWTKEQGLVVPLNVHPTIQSNDPKFAQTIATAGGLIADGNKYHFDFSNKKHAEAYLNLLQPFNQQGVRFWWNDQAESPRSEVKGAPADTWINHLYTKDGNDQGLRGFAFSRVGSGDTGYDNSRKPGVGWSEHRYTLHFTGDAYNTWDMLAFQSTFTIKEANIGIPYVSHDLGSYHADQLSDDMYMRWVQFGTFQPIFRLHSKRGKRLPWDYPNVTAQAEKFIRLRHALIPYTYSLSHESASGGLPIVRGMYWYYPTSPEAYSYDRQYFYGEKVLVSPIATPGATASTQVWFPEGKWTNYFTNATVVGPGIQSVSADYSTMPVFVKAGGIIPLAPYSDYVGQIAEDSLTLKVYTGDNGTFSLYEDEGENLNYQTGNYALTNIEYIEQEKKLSIHARQGVYAGAVEQRAYDIELYNAVIPEKILANNTKLNTVTAGSGEGWWISNDVIYIHLNKCPVTEDIDILLDGISNGLSAVNKNQGVAIYPNPATGLFTIEIEDVNKESIVSIYNANGEKVYNKMITDSKKTTVNTRTFGKGIYLVTVENGSYTFTEKLIIK